MPKTPDLPAMEGPGVAEVKDKKLEKLADDFCEKRDAKAELAEQMTGVETKILDRMAELGINRFRYADREAIIKPGKNHVRIKVVKIGDGEPEEEE